ncbi:MAG: aminomethyl-transferring glycine dehydrogenase subunit GcvPB [Phycisphaerales bacterium]|nr:MAG: aminomethyl-transferring glycine dehydrogenase subunit GcvPB [Phycisphaerales bacterium]
MITDEPLLFEITSPGQTAASLPKSDVPAVDREKAIPKALLADEPPPLPEIGETDLVRHYTALAHRLFSIDQQFYPLGSCTMKYNPRVNERAAALSGCSDLHPYQRDEDAQGLLEMLYRLSTDLAEIAGLAEVTLQPAAGAHGEMTGLLIINAYHRDHGHRRAKVLTPDTAHGTNPATCVMCGNTLVTVRSLPDGRVDLDDLRSKVDGDTSALMITDPNTCGKFDDQIGVIADILHAAGAQMYLDGANMNAVLGVTRPGDFGIDVMHYNPHKTFGTPHGCGGPGSGPVAVAEHLRPFLPTPVVMRRDDGTYGWNHDRPKSIGKVRSFYGQIGVLVRAYAYIRSLGHDGLRNVAEKSVLAANYVAARIKDRYPMPYPGPYAHEFITVPEFDRLGIREVDFAKRLLDYNIHPPTMSWPIHHCLMIEPTETESKRTLDAFCDALLAIADEAQTDPETVRSAPHTMPVGRLDEVAANRKPVVTWHSE